MKNAFIMAAKVLVSLFAACPIGVFYYFLLNCGLGFLVFLVWLCFGDVAADVAVKYIDPISTLTCYKALCVLGFVSALAQMTDDENPICNNLQNEEKTL